MICSPAFHDTDTVADTIQSRFFGYKKAPVGIVIHMLTLQYDTQ